VKQVWLAYDNDKDGRRACADFKESYGDSLEVHIPVFPKVRVGVDRYVKDPSELWEVWGDTRLRDYLLRQVDPYMNLENSNA
jgi:hypothetical protein